MNDLINYHFAKIKGAMENFGIITFRTTTLLYNEKESSSEMQEQVATVIGKDELFAFHCN